MRPQTKNLPAWTLAAALVVISCTAHAFELKDSQIGTGQYSTGYYSQSPAVFGNGLADGASAPRSEDNYKWHVNYGAQPFLDTSTNQSFWAYCIDPLTPTDFSSRTTDYKKISLQTYLTDTTAGAINYTNLFTQTTAYQDVANDKRSYSLQNANTVLSNLSELYAHAYKDSFISDIKSAAFQFVAWEIMGESSYSRLTGGLYNKPENPNNLTAFDQAFATQVDQYIDALNNDTWSSINLGATSNYTFTVYASTTLGYAQNLLSVTETKVPEPPLVALAFGGFVAWNMQRKKQRKTKA